MKRALLAALLVSALGAPARAVLLDLDASDLGGNMLDFEVLDGGVLAIDPDFAVATPMRIVLVPEVGDTLPIVWNALVDNLTGELWTAFTIGVEAGVVTGGRPWSGRLLGFVAAWGGAVQRALLPLGLSIDYPEAEATRLLEILWPGFLLLAALLLFLFLRRRAPVAACRCRQVAALLKPRRFSRRMPHASFHLPACSGILCPRTNAPAMA